MTVQPSPARPRAEDLGLSDAAAHAVRSGLLEQATILVTEAVEARQAANQHRDRAIESEDAAVLFTQRAIELRRLAGLTASTRAELAAEDRFGFGAVE